jgi:hypothetical protein
MSRDSQPLPDQTLEVPTLTASDARRIICGIILGCAILYAGFSLGIFFVSFLCEPIGQYGDLGVEILSCYFSSVFPAIAMTLAAILIRGWRESETRPAYVTLISIFALPLLLHLPVMLAAVLRSLRDL